jgi:ornithine carbamoyltransferase
MLDYVPEEIERILAHASDLKKKRLSGEPQVLQNKTAVLIFEKPSLRTRITFEVAIHELGGYPINLNSDMVQIGRRESIEDVARNLQRWVHLIIARTYSHDTIVRLAQHSSVPVINALDDAYHPCQALAFAQTLREHRPDVKKPHVVFIGDGNNVCTSLMILCSFLGYSFSLVCPQGYEPLPDCVNQCREIAGKTGGSVEITHDSKVPLSTATVVYTDVWTSMGQEHESEKRKKAFAHLQVNRKLLSLAPSDVLVSHCLPAHRGEEIESDILDSPASLALDEAENRLHVQKAIIVFLFS